VSSEPYLFDRPAAELASSTSGPLAVRAIVMPFPLRHRIGRIRDVALKMQSTKSGRHAAKYRAQVTEALRVHFRSKQVPAELQMGEIASFWRAVDLEVARLSHSAKQAPRSAT
jgi:hypothetical protein